MTVPSRGSSTPPWMKPISDRLSPTITTLVIVTVVAAVFYILVTPMRAFIAAHLALNAAAFRGPEPWQIVSSLFVHLDPISAFFSLLGIWFVGATIERELGRQRFLVLFFVPAVVANVLMAAAMLLPSASTQVMAGSSMAVLALFVAFGKLYGRAPVRVFGSLVLEARTLTLILVGFALFSDLIGRFDLVSLLGDVVAVALAFGLAGRPGSSLDDLFRGMGGGRPRRHLGIVTGGQRSPERSGDRSAGRGKEIRRPSDLN